MKRLAIACALAAVLASCGGGPHGASECSRAQASERAVDTRYYAHQATDAEMQRATAATDAACK